MNAHVQEVTASRQQWAPKQDCRGGEREVSERNARLERYLIETNHRVKNNLQMVAALLEMEADEDTQGLSAEGVVRLRDHLLTLAGLYDLLTHNASQPEGQDRLSTHELLNKLALLMQSLTAGSQIHYRAQDICMPIHKGIALTMIAHELISNALKHGEGPVEVMLSQQNGLTVLEVSSEGPCFPHDSSALRMTRTGLALVEQLSHWDLHGTIRYENRPTTGTRAVVEFPMESVC